MAKKYKAAKKWKPEHKFLRNKKKRKKKKLKI
jgi:hypothetical protein